MLSTVSWRSKIILKAIILLLGVVTGLAVGYGLFRYVPIETSFGTVTVLLVLVATYLGFQLSDKAANAVLHPYNTAQVPITGKISRGSSSIPFLGNDGVDVDGVVDRIEAADDDPAVEALVLRINTPGGSPVAAEQIRRAVAAFDGETTAFVVEKCTSAGYWIACACDEIHAHEQSTVGSIGVIGSKRNYSGLADQLGVEYERFVAGEFKDAAHPLKRIEEAERDYLQNHIDEHYEHFVQRVSEGRDMDAERVRSIGARKFLGAEAKNRGLIDAVGTKDDMIGRLSESIGKTVYLEKFAPCSSFGERISPTAQVACYAFGRGIADALADDDDEIEL